jgi:hypothetical protein
MKSFTVNFHKEDQVQAMTVSKLNEEDFHKVTEGGTQHLFELDTNVGFFIYFDEKMRMERNRIWCFIMKMIMRIQVRATALN